MSQNLNPPRGMRDFLPPDSQKREWVIGEIKSIFASFGYLPLETPAVERWEILSGKYGDEGEKLIYKFSDAKGRKLGLRYDLTVPLARVVAKYRGVLKFPFKRYQIQPVWRAERPQKGRYREFYQCDVDIVGANSLESDFEVVAVGAEVYRRFGLNATLLVNHRDVAMGLAKLCGADDRFGFLRVVDKYDKIGEEGVLEELMEKFGEETSRKARDLLSADFDSLKGVFVLKGMRSAISGLERCVEVVELLRDYGANAVFDHRLVRGLDYYTGIIYEAKIPGRNMSIGGGGRYDGLISVFAGTEIPAVGFSVGLERIIDLVEMTSNRKRTFVVHFPETFSEVVKVSKKLREAGWVVEISVSGKRIKNQLKEASDKGYELVLIFGPGEVEKGEVKVKNMSSGEEKNVTLISLIQVLEEAI